MSYLHFKNAYDRTMRIEGGISDHKFDPGGLTFMGISRYWHPSWSGWVAIDKVKKTSDLEADTLDILKIKVELFYKEQFWDRIQGDGLSALSPVIASVVLMPL